MNNETNLLVAMFVQEEVKVSPNYHYFSYGVMNGFVS